MYRLMKRTACALPALLAALPALAGECAPDRSCAISLLEEVVVTGRRAPQIVMDSSASISVITETQLARTTAYGLADVMRDVPGVQVTDAGQPGLKRIRIRGEESRRTAILIDGQEITDHWEVGTPLSLHPSMVERIEVMRGSGSVLYGPRALSGVVNFITRKGGDKPLQLELSSGFDSATGGEEWFGSAFGNLDGLEYRVATSSSDHGKRDTPQGKIPDTAFDNQSLYAWVGHDFGAHRLELGYDNYESATEVFVAQDVKTTFPLIDFAVDVPQRDREKLALFYQWSDVAPFLPVIKANIHQQWNDRQFNTFSSTLLPGPKPLQTDSNIFSDADLDVRDAVVQADWIPWSSHYLVSGIQYTDERVNQERRIESQVNGIEIAPGNIHDEASIETVALFAQDEWQIGEHTTLDAGARQYHVEGSLDQSSRPGLRVDSRNDSELIASLGITHAFGDSVVLRASAAQGYVYPSLLQFAIGAYAGSRYVNPSPELEPEKSNSFETGVRVRLDGWILDTGLFYTESRDYIDHVLCTAADNCLSGRDRIYVNVGESTAEGLEFYTTLEEGAWRPYMSLTWMNRSNRYESFVTDDSGTPSLSGTLGLLHERRISDRIDGWIDFTLRGESDSRREEPSSAGTAILEEDDSWITLNLSAGASIGAERRVSLVVALENLGDETYSTSAENLYAPGRSIAARLNLALE
ncbi:MAG: TonB-dependent receptor [Pseudomonadales bacterium]|nr:TonB-dependent receptor [Pseudomonadales bacterium]